ncbi:MAG: hypothetical protein AB1700_17330 [Bacillota bacterium]
MMPGKLTFLLLFGEYLVVEEGALYALLDLPNGYTCWDMLV